MTRAEPRIHSGADSILATKHARGFRLAAALRWAVSLGLVGLLLWIVDIGGVVGVLIEADLLLIAAAVGFFLVDRLLMIFKWLPLLRIQLPGVSAVRAGKAYFASSFAALMLPASIGGDVLRSIGLGRDRSAVLEVGVSVVVERVLGTAAAGIVAVLVLWIAWRASVPVGFLLPWALLCAGLGIAVILLPFSRGGMGLLRRTVRRFGIGRWSSLLGRLGTAYAVYSGFPRTIVVVGLLSVVEQFVPVLVFWAASLALGLSIPFTGLVVSVPLALFAARLPISVAGIGVLEGGLIFLLGLFAVAPDHALSLALVSRVVELVALLPGALWWTEITRGNDDRSAAADDGVTFDR